MPGTVQKHHHVYWSGFGAGVGFVLAAALLLWVLLSDWTKLIFR